MPIVVNLDVMMAKRKITLGQLAEKIGITQANLSILKTGKAKAQGKDKEKKPKKGRTPAGNADKGGGARKRDELRTLPV